MNKYKLYWVFQIAGWSTYALMQIIVWVLVNPDTNTSNLISISVFEAFTFLSFTHFYRYIIIKEGWLQIPFSKTIPRVLVTLVLLAIPLYPLKIGFSFLVGMYTPNLWNSMPGTTAINVFFLFLWTLIYFLYLYFEQYNRSLKYEAAMKETELAHLKSQLNPHFIFNALNSIRALVDEEPAKSKKAITQLSNILRISLIGDKKKLTKFENEYNTVRDYLELESTRYEERLKTFFDIHPDSYDYLVPPLMLQTLVENGIKHGISNLKEGGTIKLKTFVEDGIMHIQIRNSGQFINSTLSNKSEGFGLKNTRQRLKLIYGDKAHLKIFNENDNTVLTIVKIPQIELYESTNN